MLICAEGGVFILKKIAVFVFLFILCAFLAFGGAIPLSLSHLNSLKWNFTLNSRNVTAWWVYSEPSLKNPDEYINRAAQNEGAVCVDDAARAVILYLQLYNETKDLKYLNDARGGLEFLMAMEGNDGEFYNFVFPDGKINKYGSTSFKSVSWWTVRGFWALSMGAEVFRNIDKKYSDELLNHAVSAYNAIKSSLRKNGLVQGYSDMSSVFLMGLSYLYTLEPTIGIMSTAEEVANGILSTQSKTGFMNGAFFTSDEMYYWNGWGAREVQALALAGKIFGREEWIKAAEYTATHFYPKLILSLGPVYSINGSITEYPEISYADEVMVSGLTQLYLSTGKKLYADLAYIAASWYFHNNNLGELMYSSDGKGFDGLEEYFRNIDSGAESTICADLTLADLMELPDSFQGFLEAKRVFESGIIVLDSSKMNSGLGGVDVVQDGTVGNGTYSIMESYSALSSAIEVEKAGEYNVYLSYRNSNSGGKIKMYLGGTEYNFVPKINHSFELERIISNVKIPAGKTNVVIEYVNDAGSAKIEVAQLIVVPDVIEQTVSEDDVHYLTAVFNESPMLLNLSETIDGTVVKAMVYSENGILLNESFIPQDGFGFIEWIGNSIAKTKREIATEFRKVSFVATSGNFLMVNLSEFFNNSGMASESSSVPANFDNPSGNAGGAYPIGPLRSVINNGLLTVTIDNVRVPFYIGTLRSNTPDNMTFRGQRIGIPPGKYKDLFLLGSSDHGNYIRILKLYYSDGSSEDASVGFADWYLEPLPGEWIAFTFPYGLTSQMQMESGNPKLYVQMIMINDSKNLIGIEFPSQITMHLFAATLMR